MDGVASQFELNVILRASNVKLLYCIKSSSSFGKPSNRSIDVLLNRMTGECDGNQEKSEGVTANVGSVVRNLFGKSDECRC